MIGKNEAEKNLLNLIDNEEYEVVINIVREIVQKIWSSEVRIVKEYTDHGYEHSQRIMSKIYEMLKPFPQVLKKEELYLLVLGVYLHDIGMQCDIKKYTKIKELAIDRYSAQFKEDFADGTANSYTSEEQNEIRGNHHLLTGAWIEYSYKNETILSPFVKKIKSIYLEDLISICIYHSKLSINDCPDESKFSGIRLRLVASILRFGDELDIDKNRVHIETVNEFSYHAENAVFWYLHSRTTISIKNSAVKMSVYLNDEDYEEYGTYIKDIYIQKFKSKNKVLTDIMTQRGINIFISEDSAIVKNHFEEKFPEEIALNLQKMYKEQLQEEMLKKIKITGGESDDETLKQVLELLLGQKGKNNFMQKYKNEFMSEANKIKLLIDELKEVCDVPNEEVDEMYAIVSTLRRKPDISMVHNNEIIFEKAYKIFLFIKAFTTEQLTYLSDDLRLMLPVQVVSGQAQGTVSHFFDQYNRNKKYFNILETYPDLIWNLDSYSFEQVGRILYAYKAIINFNTKNIKFSDYYIYPDACNGKLLAVSVSGEANKILVWNAEKRKYEPVAALGGLTEPVRNVKIYRYKENAIIAACGIRQIYFWDLHLSSGEPTYILKSQYHIMDYILFNSLDDHLCAMGLTEHHICIWKLFEGESPAAFFGAEEDVYVINTRLADSEYTYECLGKSSFADNECPRIVELAETTPLNLEGKLCCDIYKTIGRKSSDDFGDRLKAYTVNQKNGDVYLLLNNDIYVFDRNDAVLRKVDSREGQLILGMILRDRKDKTSLLTYSIYQVNRKQVDLIHYYNIEHKKIVEHKKWDLEPHDVAYATFMEVDGEPVIYFNYSFDHSIYRIDCGKDDRFVFYTLPETFYIEHMISE